MHFLAIPAIWAGLIADALLLALWFGVRRFLPSVRYRQWLDISTALLTLWVVFFWLGLPLPHLGNFTTGGSAGSYIELGLLVGLGGSVVTVLAKRLFEPTIAHAIHIVWWRFGLSILVIAFTSWFSFTNFGGSLILSAILLLAGILLTIGALPRVYSSLGLAAIFALFEAVWLILLASWGAIPHSARLWGPILWSGQWTDILLAAALGFCLPGLVAWWLRQE